jgi:hypothetical protein
MNAIMATSVKMIATIQAGKIAKQNLRAAFAS